MMNYMKWLLHRFFIMQFFTTFVLSLTLCFAIATLAEYYSLPPQKAPISYTDSSGVR
ncbi:MULTISPECIES: hypothetical protein [unclassified Tolypothrix]|uniref:hypothetical protein n=1 Tax=unclassified Tolypothrix TaxID=2649714 RepID=UPI000AA22610|nr:MULTISPECIES: hypothetical protein [unclassified Tolypothrix]BAY93572.1 hypothetical protein NIES3275_56120 [Microchaete diplosiphon NIES-3275]